MSAQMKLRNSKISNNLTSINPATLEEIGSVAVSTAEEIDEKVHRARKAVPHWRSLGLENRQAILKKAQQLLLDQADEMAQLITREMGRPIAESLVLELQAGVDILGYYCRHARKFLDDRPIPLHHLFFKRRISYMHFQPLGVLGIIAPWNWPLLIPLGGIVPGLLSGNAVVFKNSELTPLVGEKIHRIFLESGVPEDVFTIVQGGAETGRALVDSDVEKIFFTGSTTVGQLVMQQAARSLKKVVLEMGGNDPAIVCKDANLEIAISGILWGGFNNCGQNCNSIERVYVHRAVAERFISGLIEKTLDLHVGDGFDENVDIGPLASDKQQLKIETIVQQALSSGGKLLCGGKRIGDKPGYFYEPTIILWEDSEEFNMDEEIFGPVIMLVLVDDEQEAVRLANNSSYGLCASVWSSNSERAHRIAHDLETGTVMINDCIVSFGMPEAGWTGIKKSGIGWVHGEKGLDEMVNIQYINRDPQANSQKFWWFPYTVEMNNAIKSGMTFMHSENMKKRMRAIPSTLKSFSRYLLTDKKRTEKL